MEEEAAAEVAAVEIVEVETAVEIGGAAVEDLAVLQPAGDEPDAVDDLPVRNEVDVAFLVRPKLRQ